MVKSARLYHRAGRAIVKQRPTGNHLLVPGFTALATEVGLRAGSRSFCDVDPEAQDALLTGLLGGATKGQ